MSVLGLILFGVAVLLWLSSRGRQREEQARQAFMLQEIHRQQEQILLQQEALAEEQAEEEAEFEDDP